MVSHGVSAKYFSWFYIKTDVVSTQQKCLGGVLLMSTHNYVLNILSYVTTGYIILSYVTKGYIILSYVTKGYIILSYVHVTKRYIILSYVTKGYIILSM